MNKLLLGLFSLITFFGFSQTAIESDISRVKVYKQNAEISRVAQARLLAGTQEIVLTDISTQIDPSSLQVQLTSGGHVTLLSAKYERNFLLPKKNNPEIEKLKTSLEIIQEDFLWLNNQKDIYKGMEDILNVNKDFGKSESGFTPNQLSDLVTNYKTRLFEIRKELARLRIETKEKNLQKNQIQNQLNELNAKFNKPSGNIVLLVSSVSPVTTKLKCSYIVSNAGWSPLYDLRSEGISNDVQLNYKANVYQNTGQDWRNAQLVISTGNPAKNNNRPILRPLYANIFQAHYNDKVYGNVVNKKMATMSNMAYEMEEVAAVKDNYKEGFQYNAGISENQMSIEFEILHQQDIESDGKLHIIPLESYKLNTTYIYHAVPKLDKAAFLLAKVSNWGQYNLLSGDANIFFEGAYVGKSHINARITADTMLLSMGRDESISIERKTVDKFCSTKFLGSNKKESYGYEIIVKNKKSIGIDIEILDQIPVAQNKIIQVELEDKGDASYLKKVGKLLWKFKLTPGQSKKMNFKYNVKYPKDEKISGVK
jgi:uncharacterized protein (TIGR02231 family)